MSYFKRETDLATVQEALLATTDLDEFIIRLTTYFIGSLDQTCLIHSRRNKDEYLLVPFTMALRSHEKRTRDYSQSFWYKAGKLQREDMFDEDKGLRYLTEFAERTCYDVIVMDIFADRATQRYVGLGIPNLFGAPDAENWTKKYHKKKEVPALSELSRASTVVTAEERDAKMAEFAALEKSDEEYDAME